MKSILRVVLFMTSGLLISSGACTATFIAVSLYQNYHKKPTVSLVPRTSDIMALAADQREFPAMVRIFTSGGTCSATVISDTQILTAAHCLPQQVEVTVLSLPNAKGKITTLKAMAYKANFRADYAIIKGSFKRFSKMKIMINPRGDIFYSNYNMVACGFAYGITDACFPLMGKPMKFIDQIKVVGQLYAGMSGGPVIDLNTGTVVAVNTAATDGFVIISPLIGLQDLLE
jgi:hypothetical protein